MTRQPYFLPYQQAWLADRSRFKIWPKARRIGATYVQAYEDVRDVAQEDGPPDVWFSSADQSAAKEYIDYCIQWARLLDLAARELGEVLIDDDKDLKAYVVQLANGRRLIGLSSRPAALRSKGGKLVLDEFAHHADQDAMWRAARPIVQWGFDVRVISTLNGRGNRFWRMTEDGPPWAKHKVTIEDAVAQGLADRILGRTLSDEERKAWLREERAACGDEDTWRQEYMCEALDEATAWLTWALIVACEHPAAGDPSRYQGGDCYVGMDIARRRDLTIIWVSELVGDVMWTREVVAMKKATFAEQDAALDRIFRIYNVRRCCMDQTGIGEKPVEDAQRRHGAYRVEGVLFTATAKHHLATIAKQAYEDRAVRAPEDRPIRDAHHAVRKVTTASGNPRFDADRTEAGHADEFWAHTLALHAAEMAGSPRWRPIGADDAPARPPQEQEFIPA